MPESDEKSGLARSIDALFSQATPRPAADDEPAEPPPGLPESEVQESPPPVDALEVEEVPESPPHLDAREVLDAPEVEVEVPSPSLDEALTVSEVPALEATSESGSTSFAEPEATEEVLDLVEDSPEPEAEPPEAAVPELELPTNDPFPPLEPPEPRPEPPPLPGAEDQGTAATSGEGQDGDFDGAVAAYLAGTPGAEEEVESIAAQLRERLTLDPLADGVERLVEEGRRSRDDGPLELARKIMNPAVASRLVQRMSHEEEEERRADYLAMSQHLGIMMANAFKGALTSSVDSRTRGACRDGLIAMGDTARPILEAMLEDDNRFLVQNAVWILGETGGGRASALVTSALANTDYRVRSEAVEALAKLGGEESGQLVLASLEDSNAKVRAAAAEAAGRLRLERALRPILAVLDDEDVDGEEKIPVQVRVLCGLGFLGDPGAVPAIEKRAVGSLFSKQPTEVRVAAYHALHQIGTPHARELIEQARDDKDPVVRTTVRALAAEA